MSDANPGAAADFSAQPQATTAHPGSGSWSRKQRVAFRLLFTVGGGLVVLVIYSNVGLAPLLRVTGIQSLACGRSSLGRHTSGSANRIHESISEKYSNPKKVEVGRG